MTKAKAKTGVEAAVEDENLELFEQLRELGGGATIQVYREPNREFLETVEPDAVELDSLKAMFGGGSYSLRARRDGTWIKGISMVRVRIAGLPKPGSPGQPLPDELTPAAAVLPAVVGAYPPGSVEALRYEFDAYKAAQSSKSETTGVMSLLTTLLVPVLTTALERQPENSAVEILELARKLAKDQREAAGTHPESDPIRDLGIPLLNVIQKGLPTPEPRRALPPGDPPEVTPGPAKTPKPHELAARIAAWCEPLERRNADPAMRAWCFLEDMDGSPLWDPTLKLIRMPGVLDLWATTVPRVAERREWYASFIDELRRLTDDPDADDSEGDAGDSTDAPGNGQAGAPREQVAGDPGASA